MSCPESSCANLNFMNSLVSSCMMQNSDFFFCPQTMTGTPNWRYCMQEIERGMPSLKSREGAHAASQSSSVKGLLWYAASSFFLSGMGASSKVLGAQGYNVWQITLFRPLVIAPLCLWAIFSSGLSAFLVLTQSKFATSVLPRVHYALYFTSTPLWPILMVISDKVLNLAGKRCSPNPLSHIKF
jgi:hypothetical protein